jgi:hypothetical protein
MDKPEERGLPREIQNLLILVYADHANRSFARYGGNYTPTLDVLPNELELQEQSLPDLKDWEEAVNRAADVLGHAVSKLLNASNLASLASKVGETVKEFRPDCDGLPDRLQLVLRDLGVSEEEAVKTDRVRTAKAVKALLAACEGKEPTKLVETLAGAKLETNATTMGRSLKSAGGVLDSLRTTPWEVFALVSQIDDQGKGDASKLIGDVIAWIKADEHVLAGGLASKLSDARERARKLLTKPRGPGPKPSEPELDSPPRHDDENWTRVRSGRKERLSSADWEKASEELSRELGDNPRYRLTFEWKIEEGPK